MSQEDILEILEKGGRWMTAAEIARALKRNPCNIRARLERIRRYRLARYKIEERKFGCGIRRVFLYSII